MARNTSRYPLHVKPEMMQWIEQQMQDNHRTKIGQITMMLEIAREVIEKKQQAK